MEINPKDLFFPFLGLVALVAPVCLLFWRVARAFFRIEKNEKDIDGIGKKLEKHITDKESQVGHISEVLARVDAKFDMMHDTIQDMKKDIRSDK